MNFKLCGVGYGMLNSLAHGQHQLCGQDIYKGYRHVMAVPCCSWEVCMASHFRSSEGPKKDWTSVFITVALPCDSSGWPGGLGWTWWQPQARSASLEVPWLPTLGVFCQARSASPDVPWLPALWVFCKSQLRRPHSYLWSVLWGIYCPSHQTVSVVFESYHKVQT